MSRQQNMMGSNNYGFSNPEIPEENSGPSGRGAESAKLNYKLPGVMSPKDLQSIFATMGKQYSDSSCKFIVRLFDLDKKGGLDVVEFENLYKNIRTWVDAFNSFDVHRRGFLDEKELDLALKHMKINFSSDFIKYLLAKCDDAGKKITMDKFIITCIQIQKYDGVFNSLKDSAGSDKLNYGNFLESLMKCV